MELANRRTTDPRRSIHDTQRAIGHRRRRPLRPPFREPARATALRRGAPNALSRPSGAGRGRDSRLPKLGGILRAASAATATCGGLSRASTPQATSTRRKAIGGYPAPQRPVRIRLKARRAQRRDRAVAVAAQATTISSGWPWKFMGCRTGQAPLSQLSRLASGIS